MRCCPVHFREVFVKKYKIFGGTEHQDLRIFDDINRQLHEDLNLKNIQNIERGRASISERL